MRRSVTIAIPTRNRSGFLGAALESALAAAGPGDEIVVSDNASTDDTPRILAAINDTRVTVLRQHADLGMVGNWNACLAAARGDCFLLLSDDDLLRADAIAALVAALDDRSVAFVYGRTQVIDEAGRERTLGHPAPARETGPQFVGEWFAFNRSIYPCAALFRTDELRGAGGYGASFGPFADVGAWLGVWAANPGRHVAYVARIVAAYRTHDAALSTSGLDDGIAGIATLNARYGAACGAGADRGFARLGAHFVASALRRRATAARHPVFTYAGLVIRHLPLVMRYRSIEAFWRQAVILHDPAAYERRKRQRAADTGTQA